MSKVEQSSVISKFKYQSTRLNPDWSLDKLVSLRTCLRYNNSEIEGFIDHMCEAATYEGSEVFISTIPKYQHMLTREDTDTDTGEITYTGYQTDDFKTARHRKIKTITKFCDFYEPLYRARKVSLLFHTFTRINYAKKDMSRMLDNVKTRYIALKRPIRGFLWALEISENFHIHYHLVVAVDRFQVQRMPASLKFEDLWGQRTGVEFIKKSIRAYLSKYLYKSEGKLLKHRTYSISQNLR
jgi:hypothetical protein